jgi:hypothetical protein
VGQTCGTVADGVNDAHCPASSPPPYRPAWTRSGVGSEIALIQRLYARLHTLRNDLPAARAALVEAIDRFERLGMRRELAEARAALSDLDARTIPEAAG